jgi:predicted naringenin-chalcone synthase
MNGIAPPSAVLGIGTAVPEYTMSQDEAATLAQYVCARNDDERRLVKALYRKAGVQRRHTCLPFQTAYEWAAAPASVVGGPTLRAALSNVDEAEPAAHSGPTMRDRMAIYQELAPPLALRSSSAALAAAGVAAEQITHLVTVTCTGFFAPGIDAALIEGLNLPRATERLQIGFMGCHGAINGLRAATAIAAANPRHRVLLCAVELCSIHYCFEWEPLRAVGNAVFADGSAAMVLGGGGDVDGALLRTAATGSYLLPNSADAMAWNIGNHGFEMLLSPRVPDVIGEHLRPWFEQWLGERGLTIDAVGSWAVHPGGPRILSAVEEALGLDRSATAVSREVLAEFGNMSSPTILFILDRLAKRNAPKPYVALGFGPGLAAEAAMFV